MRPHHEAGSYRRQTKVESRRQSPGRFSRASDVGHEPDRKYSGQVSKRLPPALTETKIWKMRRTEIFQQPWFPHLRNFTSLIPPCTPLASRALITIYSIPTTSTHFADSGSSNPTPSCRL